MDADVATVELELRRFLHLIPRGQGKFWGIKGSPVARGLCIHKGVSGTFIVHIKGRSNGGMRALLVH